MAKTVEEKTKKNQTKPNIDSILESEKLAARGMAGEPENLVSDPCSSKITLKPISQEAKFRW